MGLEKSKKIHLASERVGKLDYKKKTRMSQRISLKQVFKVGECYALTLTPEDKNQFFDNKERYRKFHNRIFNTMMDLEIDYDLVIEITEPIGFKIWYEGPRLHCHGMIRFRTRKLLSKFLLHGHRSLCKLGGVDIDTVDDPEIWSTYCKKQKILPKDRRLYNTILLPQGKKET